MKENAKKSAICHNLGRNRESDRVTGMTVSLRSQIVIAQASERADKRVSEQTSESASRQASEEERKG